MKYFYFKCIFNVMQSIFKLQDEKFHLNRKILMEDIFFQVIL